MTACGSMATRDHHRTRAQGDASASLACVGTTPKCAKSSVSQCLRNAEFNLPAGWAVAPGRCARCPDQCRQWVNDLPCWSCDPVALPPSHAASPVVAAPFDVCSCTGSSRTLLPLLIGTLTPLHYASATALRLGHREQIGCREIRGFSTTKSCERDRADSANRMYAHHLLDAYGNIPSRANLSWPNVPPHGLSSSK